MYLEIYAANLTHGGATVTASSLLDGLIQVIQGGGANWIEKIDFVISPQIAQNLPPEAFRDPTSRTRLTVRADHPKQALLKRSQPKVDVRFAVFGPEYVRSRAKANVAGFADGTLIPSWHAGKPQDETSTNFITNTRNTIKRRVLRRYDAYVVQTLGMAAALTKRFPGKQVSVLPNLLGRPFLHPENRETQLLPVRQSGEARFFYPAKGYPHKNHRILADVAHQYHERFGERLTFVVTLSPEEVHAINFAACPDIINIGPVAAAVLPSLYEQTDGLFFPSLNETFSSAPLEAAFMRKPVIASNIQFAHETLRDLATYFDPADAADAATQIRLVIEQLRQPSNQLMSRIGMARDWAEGHADPRLSALRLLEILRNATR